MPSIFCFLDYVPFPPPDSLPERLLAKRREMGWTIQNAANVIGVNPSTWGDWEHGNLVLLLWHRVKLAKLLCLPFDALDREMAGRWRQSHERV
jgi:DNA-binding XRE family transcriptional regulator